MSDPRASKLDNAWEALERSVYLPKSWVAGVGAAALASVVHVRDIGHGTAVDLNVTTITGVLIAILWLPTLLRVFALTGGNVKTPAGEATTGGLLSFFASLAPEEREASASALAATIEQVETSGSPEQRASARELREEIEGAAASTRPESAASAQRRLAELAREYDSIRSTQESSDERTRQMTQLVSRARVLAASVPSAANAKRWFGEDTEGGRIIGLAVIQAVPDPADWALVESAIARPRSAFEQFHALRAADALLPLLDSRRRRDLLNAIRSQIAETEGEGRWITPSDSSRWSYAHDLVAQWGKR
jgi:hypothetical protein